MESSRANIISSVLKNVQTLGKNIRAPGLVAPEAKNAIGTPVAGTGFIRIFMYVIAGILLIGIILLGVDQWITPVFQRSPGGRGYIPVPGADMSQVFWPRLKDVANINVGTIPIAVVADGVPQPPVPLIVDVLEGQTAYSLTMDVFISDEYPQDLGAESQRVFFTMSQTVDNPTLRVGLDNEKNTVYITCFDSDGLQQSVTLDNVPIHSPFRVGVVISPYAMEGYLNGRLVQTIQLNTVPKPPSKGDKIFTPANIKIGGKVLSKGIRVLNVRAFGYIVPATEMDGRMGDLIDKSIFNPPSIV
jgi:hypothetical protein